MVRVILRMARRSYSFCLLYLQRWNDPQYVPLREASLKIFEQI